MITDEQGHIKGGKWCICPKRQFLGGSTAIKRVITKGQLQRILYERPFFFLLFAFSKKRQIIFAPLPIYWALMFSCCQIIKEIFYRWCYIPIVFSVPVSIFNIFFQFKKVRFLIPVPINIGIFWFQKVIIFKLLLCVHERNMKM